MIGEVYTEEGIKKVREISGAIPTGLPVGTWISFEKDQAPDNKWIKAGETFDENLYPALYLFLGTNKVPERFDHNRLGDIEEIPIANFGTSEATAFTAQYDGFITIENRGYCYFKVKTKDGTYSYIETIQSGGYANTSMGVIKKGDKIWKSESGSSPVVYARWYKHPMFIKATSAIEITDQSTFLNTVQSLVQTSNSYSTEETATGGFWIDGKPIYRKVVTYNSEFVVSQSGTDFTRTTLDGSDVDNYISITAFNSTGARNVKRFTPCGFAWNNDTSVKIFSCSGVANHFLGLTLEYTKL